MQETTKVASSKGKVANWIFSIAATGVVGFVVGFLYIILLLSVSEHVSGWVKVLGAFCGAWAVLFVAVASCPREARDWWIKLIGVTVIVAVIWMGYSMFSIGPVLGGVAGILFGVWMLRSGGHLRAKKMEGPRRVWLMLVILVLALGGLGFRWMDFPALRDESHELGVAGIEEAYGYEIGGFLKTERLIRLDGVGDSWEKLVSEFGLEKTEKVPRGFWRLAPYYWPKGMPEGGVAYVERGFGFGLPLETYFMLYVPSEDRVYLWMKQGF